MEKILKEVLDINRKYINYGQVASYIPELKNARRDDLGICIIDKDNNLYKVEIVIINLQYRVFLNL